MTLDRYMKYSYVYILSNKYRTVFYIGVTADLSRRMQEHRGSKGSSFCRRYYVKYLVYYELHISIIEAIKREKQLKKWNRKWKLNLIEASNPYWRDLYEDLCGDEPSHIADSD